MPFVLDEWLNSTNLFTNRACGLLFYSKDEREKQLKNIDSDANSVDDQSQKKSFLVNANSLRNIKRHIMGQFNELICSYEEKNRTIVAYFLGTLLNKVGRNKDTVRIFSEGVTEHTVFNFLDLVFYVYSFFPNYSNTQRFLAIISYVRDEYDIFEKTDRLQQLIDRYAFIFDKANMNDVINLILFCSQAKIEIPFIQEERLVEELRRKDDPILWASYLLYARYSPKYYLSIRDEMGAVLLEKIDAIVQKESIYTYREFWWVLIFNKCPFLTPNEQAKIDEIINALPTGTDTTAGARRGDIFVDYVKNNSSQFFEWDISTRDFLRNLTFKTRQRSIFKNYHENPMALYWSSL